MQKKLKRDKHCTLWFKKLYLNYSVYSFIGVNEVHSYIPLNSHSNIYVSRNFLFLSVAVRIETDKVLDLQVGQLIHVECRAWFHGVKHDTKDMSGLVRFEVMLRG